MALEVMPTFLDTYNNFLEENRMNKISIIGSGYVGYATGKGLEIKGCDVLFHDTDFDRLEELVQEGCKVEPHFEKALNHGRYVFVALPTPSTDKGIDLSILEGVSGEIAEYLKGSQSPRTVVFKSTAVPGTYRKLAEEYDESTAVFYMPEFLQEATALQDFLNPDRVIIGGDDEDQEVTNLIEMFEDFGSPVYPCTFEEAEMIKYANNCLYAANISFFNEIYKMCNKVDADEDFVRQRVLESRHFGTHPWFAGKPFGGHCLPKDLKALIKSYEDNGLNPVMLKAIEEINEDMK